CILDKGTLVCGPDGQSDVQENVTTICRSEVQAFAICGACYPQSDDGACVTCAKQSCCQEFKDAISESTYLDWSDCRGPCNNDAACESACDTKYASVKTKLDAVTACAKNKCASACSATPPCISRNRARRREWPGARGCAGGARAPPAPRARRAAF